MKKICNVCTRRGTHQYKLARTTLPLFVCKNSTLIQIEVPYCLLNIKFYCFYNTSFSQGLISYSLRW